MREQRIDGFSLQQLSRNGNSCLARTSGQYENSVTGPPQDLQMGRMVG